MLFELDFPPPPLVCSSGSSSLGASKQPAGCLASKFLLPPSPPPCRHCGGSPILLLHHTQKRRIKLRALQPSLSPPSLALSQSLSLCHSRSICLLSFGKGQIVCRLWHCGAFVRIHDRRLKVEEAPLKQ